MRDLIPRTRAFAIDVIKFCRKLPRGIEEDVIRRQVIRSAMSIAAHYRAAQRARSHADFTNKICGALEEADETRLWFEIIIDSALAAGPDALVLRKEAGELTAIFASMVVKLRRRNKRVPVAAARKRRGRPKP